MCGAASTRCGYWPLGNASNTADACSLARRHRGDRWRSSLRPRGAREEADDRETTTASSGAVPARRNSPSMASAVRMPVGVNRGRVKKIGTADRCARRTSRNDCAVSRSCSCQSMISGGGRCSHRDDVSDAVEEGVLAVDVAVERHRCHRGAASRRNVNASRPSASAIASAARNTRSRSRPAPPARRRSSATPTSLCARSCNAGGAPWAAYTTYTNRREDPAVPPTPREQRLRLSAVSLAVLMTSVDNTVVNVALPSIGRDLGPAELARVDRQRVRARVRHALGARWEAR